MKWLIKLFFGKKYFIKYTNQLKEDEILIIGHRIYISKEVINDDKFRIKK